MRGTWARSADSAMASWSWPIKWKSSYRGWPHLSGRSPRRWRDRTQPELVLGWESRACVYDGMKRMRGTAVTAGGGDWWSTRGATGFGGPPVSSRPRIGGSSAPASHPGDLEVAPDIRQRSCHQCPKPQHEPVQYSASHANHPPFSVLETRWGFGPVPTVISDLDSRLGPRWRQLHEPPWSLTRDASSAASIAVGFRTARRPRRPDTPAPARPRG